MEYTKDTLAAEIGKVRARLAALEALYEAEYGGTLSPTATHGLPYAGIRPIKAIQAYLAQNDGKAPYSRLMDDLIKGGCAMGTKSQQWAINKSLLFNARQGVLTINGKKPKGEINLKPTDVIGLP
jgi:hypothetical protein